MAMHPTRFIPQPRRTSDSERLGSDVAPLTMCCAQYPFHCCRRGYTIPHCIVFHTFAPISRPVSQPHLRSLCLSARLRSADDRIDTVLVYRSKKFEVISKRFFALFTQYNLFPQLQHKT